MAREAIVGALSPPRLVALHATVLAALEVDPPEHRHLARLAHHAEESGNRLAVLKYAPAAAERAAALGAHREAAAQYARALRFSDSLELQERACLLEAHSEQCMITGQLDEAISERMKAVAIWQKLGNKLKEGQNLAQIPGMLVNAGRNAESERVSLAAIELLEELSPGPELANAYSAQSRIRMLNRDNAEAIAWGERAIDLAERFHDIETLITVESSVGAAMILNDDERGRAHMERSIELAREAGHDADVARGYTNLGSSYGEYYQFALADRYLAEGVAFCTERDLDIWHCYMAAWQALSFCHQGEFQQAIQFAETTLQRYGASVISRIMALLALGRVRTRIGDAGANEALDEALALAEPTQTLQRIGPVRAARAEAAWLARDLARVAEEAGAAFELAQHHRHRWHVGEMSYWLWKCGKIEHAPPAAATPYALQIAGDWAGAAAAWSELGCPYEEARAMADSDQEVDLRRALDTFDRLGARPMSLVVARRLREIGADRIPRGPRATTRGNPAGLTDRQVAILALMIEGLRNTEIAERLYLSPKTVEHHVSAIFAKLEVATRGAAIRAGIDLGISPALSAQNYLPQPGGQA